MIEPDALDTAPAESLDYGSAPESTAHVRAWIDAHQPFGHFIDGRWPPPGGDFLVVREAGQGPALARVARGSGDDVDAAVGAARRAFSSWATLPGAERARFLDALAREVQKFAGTFAQLDSLASGRPVRLARDLDAPLAVRHFQYHAGWAHLMDEDLELREHRPLGVAALILPREFPLLQIAWAVAPALATGNTVVLKPSAAHPLPALHFARACERAGLPDGVVNVVTGDAATGAAVVAHADIDRIAFSGSLEVGREIRTRLAGTGRPLSMLLRGRSTFLVFEDADLDAAVEAVAESVAAPPFPGAPAGARVLVQEGVAEAFVRKLIRRLERLRPGDPMDRSTDLAAPHDSLDRARLVGLVEEARQGGATVWQAPHPEHTFPPTVLSHVAPAHEVARDQVSAPLALILTFRSAAEAVDLANNDPHGLAASVWTENVNVALDVGSRLRVGTVWVNACQLLDAAAAFGGTREGGLGRVGGREGLWEHLRPRWRPERGELRAAASGGAVEVRDAPGLVAGEGRGGREDARRAVEAAVRAWPAWAAATSATRAQTLSALAAALAYRQDELVAVLVTHGAQPETAAGEVRTAVARLLSCAARAERWAGALSLTPSSRVSLTTPEPLGVVALVPPRRSPLLGLVSTLAPLVATGNVVVIVPTAPEPVTPALSPLLAAAAVPAGIVNLITGGDLEVMLTLAAHDEVDGIWYFGEHAGAAPLERLAAGNMKRVWIDAVARDWLDPVQAGLDEFLRHATQVRTLWIPYGA
jgi:aldehyde dehydrogenase (NAD+)